MGARIWHEWDARIRAAHERASCGTAERAVGASSARAACCSDGIRRRDAAAAAAPCPRGRSICCCRRGTGQCAAHSTVPRADQQSRRRGGGGGGNQCGAGREWCGRWSLIAQRCNHCHKRQARSRRNERVGSIGVDADTRWRVVAAVVAPVAARRWRASCGAAAGRCWPAIHGAAATAAAAAASAAVTGGERAATDVRRRGGPRAGESHGRCTRQRGELRCCARDDCAAACAVSGAMDCQAKTVCARNAHV